ncbi:MAG: hypothetical protein JSW00_08020 [Thermoplasmata archaeon]|nr:MAG: hypothetical protein JSW00_08020 [Thermoplasmata archaeon]
MDKLIAGIIIGLDESMDKKTERTKCHSYKNDFDVELTGSHAISISFPGCKTSGWMEY